MSFDPATVPSKQNSDSLSAESGPTQKGPLTILSSRLVYKSSAYSTTHTPKPRIITLNGKPLETLKRLTYASLQGRWIPIYGLEHFGPCAW